MPISKEELKSLLEKQPGHCVSVFMPTYRTGAESQQNQIRLRNLLRRTEEKLAACNLRPQEAKTILEPAYALAGNALFWRRQKEGLAVFLSGGTIRSYCLPLPFDEAIFVGNRFHIKPLLPLLHGEEQFYLLALSQNSVKLLGGTRHEIKEIGLEGVPKSLTEALSYDEPEKQVRFRTGMPGGGERGSMISGHGAEIDNSKDNLLKYFRQIDKGLRGILKDGSAPMVLAGVDYLFPIYRDANTYPHLIEEGLSGNPEGMNVEQMHRQAWQIVAPYFLKAENDALLQFRQSSGTGLASTDIREIVTAAFHGRIGVLFVALGRNRWGAFSPLANEVVLHERMEEKSEDLLDLAAIQTFLNGGAVFLIPQERIPENELMAAVFRY